MQDLRIAWRGLIARPGFSLVAILTLALGIGANTAVFTVVNGVLLAPLPYADPARVVVLQESTPQFPVVSVNYQNYKDWRDRSQSFETIAAFRPTNLTITGTGEPERVPAKMITATLLTMLGVRPAEGRNFTAAEDAPGAAGVAILSDSFATRRFGGASGGSNASGSAGSNASGQSHILGRVITLDNQPYTIVGVLPPGFELFQPADIFVPMGPWAATLPDDRGWHPGILPVARLRDGVTLEQARTEMTMIARQVEQENPAYNRGVKALVNPLLDQVVQNVRPALVVLLAAVSLVLLIACANVANLLLSRAVTRQKEIAVRTALGASRGRLLRQLIVESLLLATLGGIVGLIVAAWSVNLLLQVVTTGLPRAAGIALDWPVLLFALGASLLTGLAFGLAPALQATRFDIRETLNETSRGSSGSVRHNRMRNTLVVAEIALALVLLVSAGLLLRSFSRMQQVEPGFDPQALLAMDMPLSPVAYGPPEARTAMVDRVIARVRALPGVRDAAVTSMLPMLGAGATIHFNIAGRPPKGPEDFKMAGYRAVSADYFRTMRIPLRRGRLLDDRDRHNDARVIVINESMARIHFEGRDPIGQRIQTGTEPDPDEPYMEVVGIVGDVKSGYEAGAKAEMYVPYAQPTHPLLAGMYRNIALVTRGDAAPLSLAGAVRAAVREIDPNQPLAKVRTMEQAIADTAAQPRLQSALLTVFALVAVTLALIGVYGVMAYSVSQRTQEIGLRVALGASSESVVRLVVAQGARLALAGIVIGLAGAAAASIALKSLLFQATGTDWLIFTTAPIVLALAALLACYLPARRAARVSPMVALGAGNSR